MTNRALKLRNGTLSRIGYMDVPIPAELVGLTEEVVRATQWSEPTWAEAGQPRFGAAMWVADVGDTRIALDPIMAADAFLRATPETEAEQQIAIRNNFEEKGYPVESIDIVLLTHIEGVGAIGFRAEDGTWSPFFPKAKIMVSDVTLREFVTESKNAATDANGASEPSGELAAFTALLADGHIETYTNGQEITSGIVAEVSGAHATGHTVFNIALDDDDEGTASFIGHLAISPIHLTTGPCEGFHADPNAAYKVLQALTKPGRTLIGPLWPAPGYGTWNGTQLVSARP